MSDGGKVKTERGAEDEQDRIRLGWFCLGGGGGLGPPFVDVDQKVGSACAARWGVGKGSVGAAMATSGTTTHTNTHINRKETRDRKERKKQNKILVQPKFKRHERNTKDNSSGGDE